MKRFDQETASCHVFTFKEGLLSPVAHDLRLRVTRFSLEVSEQVVVKLDAGSLVVDSAMKDGHENPGALSAADAHKVERQIREEVLHSARHGEIVFRSTSFSLRADGGYDVRGELTLHGVTRSIDASTSLQDGRQRLAFVLQQPDYGITPFRAMMGTLKIRPDVRIEIVA